MLSQQAIGELEFSGPRPLRPRAMAARSTGPGWKHRQQRRPPQRRLHRPRRTPAAAPAAADTGSMLAQLTQLGELRASGVLTETEFEVQKVRILNG